ncbi:MAG: hypothetical protein K2X66_08325 [Cyanobacteria bacterium]|nr:hypothetical protein [Cyanobacteriota bacterium]
MTGTDVKFSELQKGITHLKEISEEGWVLQWGESPETTFELICKGTSTAQVEGLDKLLTKAHQEAIEKLT